MLLGGAEILFARIADALVDLGAEVTITDDTSGIYQKLITSPKVNFDVYNESPDRKLRTLTEDAVLITATLFLPHLFKFFDLSSDAVIIYWSIHPCHLLHTLPLLGAKLFQNLELTRVAHKIFFRSETRALRHLLTEGVNKNSLLLMDSENQRVNEEVLQIDLSGSKYLPIPTTQNSRFKARKAPDRNNLTFGWLGRLCDFKKHSLIRVLKDLNDLLISSRSIRVREFLIAGEGPERESLEGFTKSLSYNCRFVGTVDPRCLDEVFDTVDLVFAMGTSALDLGIRSIPVCLVDAAYRPMPSAYRYRWLFDTEKFNLGSIIDSNFSLPEANKYSIKDIVDSLNIRFFEISRASYLYVLENHQLNVVAKNLLSISAYSRQKISDPEVRAAQERGLFSLFMKFLRGFLRRNGGLPSWLRD